MSYSNKSNLRGDIAESNVIGDENAPGEELVIPEEKSSGKAIIVAAVAVFAVWMLIFGKK